MKDMDSEDRVTRLLDELGPAEPPAGFSHDVMTRIATAGRTPGKVLPFGSGGMVMTKKAMLGLAAAAAIVFGVFAVRGFPTVDRGTEGTIGAAKKYQAPQMAASDVKTGDASVQEFLQSDTFDRLMKDPQARALLADASFREHMRNQAFADAMRDAAVRGALRNAQLARIFGDDEARAELARQLKSETRAAAEASDVRASARASLSADMRNAIRDALSREDLRNSLRNQAVWDALSDAALRQNMRADYAAALESAAMVSALHSNALSAAIRNGALESALRR